MKINQIQDDKEILQCLAALETLYGIEPNEIELVYTGIVSHLREHYHYMTLDDILRAFSLAAAGTLRTNGKTIDLECYGRPISIAYIAKVLVPFQLIYRRERQQLRIEENKQLRLNAPTASKEETNKAIQHSIREYIAAAKEGRDFRVAFFHYHYINENIYQFTPSEKIAAMKAIEPQLQQQLFHENERKSKFQRLTPALLKQAQQHITRTPEATTEAQRYLAKQWIINQANKIESCG